jgi:hypothetical protein
LARGDLPPEVDPEAVNATSDFAEEILLFKVWLKRLSPMIERGSLRETFTETQVYLSAFPAPPKGYLLRSHSPFSDTSHWLSLVAQRQPWKIRFGWIPLVETIAHQPAG